jgi:hemolysin III
VTKSSVENSLGVVEPVHPRDALRPRLRGWLHLVAAPVALVAGIVLIACATHHRIAVTIYTVSVVGLFSTSAAYHRLTWTPRARQIMKRLDHSMIFVLIAGSYTGFGATALSGRDQQIVLTTVWTGALFGIAFRVLWPGAPRWVLTPAYIALGWVAIFFMGAIIDGGGVTAAVLMMVGGGFYSLGAAAYATRRPDPRPHIFGYHEVFHACTLVGAACHYAGIWFALY